MEVKGVVMQQKIVNSTHNHTQRVVMGCLTMWMRTCRLRVDMTMVRKLAISLVTCVRVL